MNDPTLEQALYAESLAVVQRRVSRWRGRLANVGVDADALCHDVVARVLIRWAHQPPQDAQARAAYLMGATDNAAVDGLRAAKRQRKLTPYEEDEPEQPARAQAAQQTFEASDALATPERLRRALDALAWERSSREHVHYWLLWLLSLRGAVGQRLRPSQTHQTWLDAVEQTLVWHPHEREHVVHAQHPPSLQDLWAQAQALLYQEGDLDAQTLQRAWALLQVSLSLNTLQQWTSRTYERVRERCHEIGLDYQEFSLLLRLQPPRGR